MEKSLLTASLIMFGTTGLHIFAGTAEIMAPFLAADLHPVVQGTQLVVWHVISALLAILAAALFSLARRASMPLFWTVLAILAAFVIIFATVSVLSLGSLIALPQWTLFLASALLMLWSLRRTQS